MIELPTTKIIPAEAGTRLLWPDPETGALEAVDKVIAWEIIPIERAHKQHLSSTIERYTLWVYPVTTEGRDNESLAVLHPDGTVDEPEIRHFDSLEAANAPDECARRKADRGQA